MSAFFITQILIGSFMTKPVQAHEAAFLETLIDADSKQYASAIVIDKPGWGKESNHIEAKLGSFASMFSGKILDTAGTKKPWEGFDTDATSNTSAERKSLLPTDEKLKNNADKDGFIFTFPSKEKAGPDTVSNKETTYAQEISQTLTTSLNSLIMEVREGRKAPSVEVLIQSSMLLRTAGASNTRTLPANGGGSTILKYGSDVKDTDKDKSKKSKRITIKDGAVVSSADVFTYWPQADSSGNLYVYVFHTNASGNVSGKDMKGAGGTIYAMPKGYSIITGIEDNDLNPRFPKAGTTKERQFALDKEDVKFITIHHLAYEANFAYTQRGYSVGNSDIVGKNNKIEEMIYETFYGIITGIGTILGLYTTNELIYNQGLRGSSSYNDGTMSDSWWAVVVRYHMIFQAIAWILVALAIAKILLQMNFSTINPNVKISIMETLQKLFVVGFLLVLCIPLIRFMISINNSIVSIFGSQVDLEKIGYPKTNGMIAGLLLMVVYMGIYIYTNFVYIMRSIMIALLTASAPIFIVSMAFSTKGKGLFDNWIKEISANIFLQAFHAFSFAFLWSVLSSSKGIESMVVATSIIPLTEFFRSMVFGQSGSFALSQAKASQNAVQGLATKAVSSTASKGASAIADKMTEKETVGSGKEGGGNKEFQNKERNNSNSLSQTLMDKSKQALMNEGPNQTAKAIGLGAASVVAGGVSAVGGAMGSAMNFANGVNHGDSHALSKGIEGLGDSLGGAVGGIGKGVGMGMSAMSAPSKTKVSDEPKPHLKRNAQGGIDEISDRKKMISSGSDFGAMDKAGNASVDYDMDRLQTSNPEKYKDLQGLMYASLSPDGQVTDSGRELLSGDGHGSKGLGISEMKFNPETKKLSITGGKDYWSAQGVSNIQHSKNGSGIIMSRSSGFSGGESTNPSFTGQSKQSQINREKIDKSKLSDVGGTKTFNPTNFASEAKTQYDNMTSSGLEKEKN